MLADALDRRVEHGRPKSKSEQNFAVLALLDDFGIERRQSLLRPGALQSRNDLAGPQLLRRAHEGAPKIGAFALVQRRLDPRDASPRTRTP